MENKDRFRAEIDEILKRHSKSKYEWNDNPREFDIDDRSSIIDDIEWLFKQELGKQEAKIYAYEAILSNSNFKMAVVREKKESKNG